MAFWAFFSIFPLRFIFVTLLGYVLPPSLQGDVLRSAAPLFPAAKHGLDRAPEWPVVDAADRHPQRAVERFIVVITLGPLIDGVRFLEYGIGCTHWRSPYPACAVTRK
jgi:hypothetical protein